MSPGLLIRTARSRCLSVTRPLAQRKLTVSAGNFDRRDCVVPFKMPEDTEPGVYTLTDDTGKTTPLQVGPSGARRLF